MTNNDIARLLRQIAAIYLIKGENRFKIIAYENAADSIQKMAIEAEDLWRNGKLDTVAGIGKSIEEHLDELFKTGKSKHFEEIMKGFPKAVLPLLEIPGIGPKKAYKLVNALKLASSENIVEDLIKAAKEDKIAHIENFGEKSQNDVLEALEGYKKGLVKEKRMSLPFAWDLASELIKYLKGNKSVVEAVPLGSLRRRVATVGDIDIAASTKKPEEILDYFTKYPNTQKIVERGPTGATILLTNGHHIDLRVIDPSMMGSMLQYFTGSKSHNIALRELALKMGMSLSEYGIKSTSPKADKNIIKGKYNKKRKIYEYGNEEDFYSDIGLTIMAPELRENRGEIEAALNHKLPDLIEDRDIKGEFHIHSNYNLEPSHDLGVSPLEDILKKASELNYEYIGISDHNPNKSNHTENQINQILKVRRHKFEQIMSSTKFTRIHLLIMLEVDILVDGHIPLPDEAFDYLDGIIVSVHSSFNLPKEKMTERILRGLSYPKVKILGHPTGKLLGKRESYDLDWEKIYKICREKDIALEINSYPDRLDLSDFRIYEAIHHGVRLAIDSDSHNAAQMTMTRFGVSEAKRGWAEKSDIINSKPYTDIKKWFKL